MSDSQVYEEVTLARDGVTVVKRFEEDEFPVPAIAFEFESDRDEEVTLRLVDQVPEDVAVEDLGFHPEYGSEYWTIDEDEITFERELGANEEYTTVYGIRATGTDNVEQFLSEPELAEVDPPLPEDAAEDGAVDIDDVIPESEDDAVRDVISGEAEDVPGLEDDEEPTDEEIETLDLKDPNEEGAAAKSGAVPDASGPAAPDEDTESAETTDSDGDDDKVSTAESEAVEPAAVDLDAGSLVAALATELRENNVSAEDVKLLRQAFEIAGQEGGSVVARIQRLQSDVADLRAYTDALEEFLDETGTAQQVIEGVQSDIDELESQLDGMESQLHANADTVEAVSTEVESIEDDLQTVLDDVDVVEGDVADMSEDVESVTEEMDDVREDVDDVSHDVADVEETLERLEDDVEELRGQVSDENLEGRLEEIESEVSDLRDWQEQIKSTFAG